MATMQATRNLNASQREQKRLMRELSAANADMKRIYQALSGNFSIEKSAYAKRIAKDWLQERGLLDE